MKYLFTAITLFTALVAAHPLASESQNTDSSTRKWDFHISGKHLTARDGMRTNNPDMHRYSMRGRVVDPSSTGVDPGVRQYSGYLDDMENDKHLFFWFFESRSKPKEDPVILWLNGGPGCSSMLGLFTVLGPSLLDPKIGGLKRNPYSWNNNASILFLDQPVNTGFSYSKSNPVNNTVAAGKDVYALLTLFFQKFPQYSKQDFHIAGESYAGHYIPVFAQEILSHKPKDRDFNLKSIMIGNGIVDALTQSAYFQPMACGEGGIPSILDPAACRTLNVTSQKCTKLLSDCYKAPDTNKCAHAQKFCAEGARDPFAKSGYSLYDMRQNCATPAVNCGTEYKWVSSYFNKTGFLDAIGAETIPWQACNDPVDQRFTEVGDWAMPYHQYLPSILEKIPVLIYAGDTDYICNWLGNKAWTEKLEWKGKSEYNRAEMKPFKLKDGKQVGETKGAMGLTFTRVYQAGHMVPADQPEAALALLTKWLEDSKSGVTGFRATNSTLSYKRGVQFGSPFSQN
ncbi:hypothetical protein H072_11220 [Dactylellina haptotyla CBS 200.50]|uniref:Carboxypeptidase n=1 Tax=Dactylellina haptotyla (strain CBS 200.50) TaxID=1284197 RepID=S8B8N6_DACHA|nr:hypothetical protein H072_11220 [Dactylellina haptotyla CBS 200.50]